MVTSSWYKNKLDDAGAIPNLIKLMKWNWLLVLTRGSYDVIFWSRTNNDIKYFSIADYHLIGDYHIDNPI